MALDTTVGGADSDSYSDVADLKLVWDDLGFDYSSLSDPQIEVAARQATDWLDGVFGHRFGGYRVNGRNQARIWPRVGVYDREGQIVVSDAIPREILKSHALATRHAVSGTDLAPEIVPGLIAKREKIGPMDTEYVNSGAVEDQRTVLTAVNDILSILLTSSGNTQLVMRA